MMSTRNSLTKIGTSHGLVNPCSDTEPEQVYVFIDNLNDRRPIRIEGWKGYSIPMTMNLTRKQAVGLQALLVEALLHETDSAMELARFINTVRATHPDVKVIP